MSIIKEREQNMVNIGLKKVEAEIHGLPRDPHTGFVTDPKRREELFEQRAVFMQDKEGLSSL